MRRSQIWPLTEGGTHSAASLRMGLSGFGPVPQEDFAKYSFHFGRASRTVISF